MIVDITTIDIDDNSKGGADHSAFSVFEIIFAFLLTISQNRL